MLPHLLLLLPAVASARARGIDRLRPPLRVESPYPIVHDDQASRVPRADEKVATEKTITTTTYAPPALFWTKDALGQWNTVSAPSSEPAVTTTTMTGPPVSQPNPDELPSPSKSTPKARLCNGYAELCSRRYSNVSMVGAHNSPFVLSKNLAANQALHVTQQLDDGIRFVQGQMHFPKGSSVPHFCHTSCDLLDAGPITTWLGDVRKWVERHPDNVVTILLGNGAYNPPDKYASYIESTGITKYAYVPTQNMQLDDWPTLGEMIRTNKRIVILMDYKADEKAYPWLLDEFAYLWETPFDPVLGFDAKAAVKAGTSGAGMSSPSFSCAVHRPPDLSGDDARNRLYLMNHNLNVEVAVMGSKFSVPAVALANQTNAATGDNSLGAAAQNCQTAWGRPPLVLNVDYYNHGTPPGSVFHVVASLNGVTYNGTCCGLTARLQSGCSRCGVSMVMFVVVLVMMM